MLCTSWWQGIDLAVIVVGLAAIVRNRHRSIGRLETMQAAVVLAALATFAVGTMCTSEASLFVAAGVFAANMCLGAPAGLTVALLCLSRAVRAMSPRHAMAAPALERCVCLAMLWSLIPQGARYTLKQHAERALHIGSYRRIREWEHGERDIEGRSGQEEGDQFIAMYARLRLESAQKYHVLRAVLRMAWAPLAAIAVVNVFVKMLIHARGIILANIFGSFAQDSSMAVNGLHMIGLWAALGLATPVKAYAETVYSKLMMHIQDALTTKALEVYLQKSTGGGFVKGIKMGVSNKLYDFRMALASLTGLATDLMSQALNIYVVVAMVGWRALIPAAVALADAAINYALLRSSLKYKLAKKQKTRPDFRKDFDTLIGGLRALKLHAWEALYLHGEVFSCMNEPAPMYLMALGKLSAVLGMVLPDVASSLVLISYLAEGSTVSYVKVAVVLQSTRSLMAITKLLSAIPSYLMKLRETEDFFHDLYEAQRSPRIVRGPAGNGAAVTMDGCSFSWGDDKFALQPLTLDISPGEFIAVTGKIGSGKSSLLAAICGEMPLTDGAGCVAGRVSYVSQRPWIMNATFRDNVLLGNAYDAERYARVISACALADDLELLPAGDLTEIGPRGINLSGGQNARLGLARAIYANADIVVMDDVLSAVDAEVGRHIIENVLVGDGLLGHATRILATHADYVVPLCDRVLQVTDGRVVVVEQANIGYRGTLAMPSPKGAARDTATQSSKGEFTMAPEITVPPFSAALVRKFLALSGYAAVLACIAVQFACAYSFYYIERTRMELMAGSGTHMDSANVRRFLLVSMGVAIARSAATELGEWLRNTLWFERVLAKMQRLLLDSLLSTPLAVVERLPQHTLYMLFNSELIGVALMLPREICIRTYDASLAGYSLLNSAQVMSVAVIPLLLLVIAQRRFTRRVDVAVNQMRMECGQQAMHRKINLIHELLASHEVVRIHGVASAYVHKLLHLGTAHAHTAWVVSHMDRFTPVLSAAAAELPVLCILAWMKWRQCVLGLPVSPGDVHITVDLAQGSFLKLSSLTMSSSNMAHFSPLLAKFYAYAENLPREAPRLIADHRPPTNWPSEGTIGVRDYRMRYRDDQDDVLRGVSFDTRAREKIGVVGRTGAGKSSLIHALLRLTEPSAGSVTIDGVDISTIGLHDLRSRISVVPQDPVLFEGSIRDNLDPCREHTDAEVWAAIRAARIEDLVAVPSGAYAPSSSSNGSKGALSTAEDVPGPWVAGTGLDKWVEAEGRNLSMGQRQLVCLCRALLWRRRILILDEATANIDSATDATIQGILRTEFEDTTVITIAHRLRTVMDSDRILVMDQGRVAEFDTPANLRARGGLFAQLVASMEFNEAAK